MQRLIAAGLMFGSLFHVDSPVLVDRYNRALDRLTGRQTALADFHIDLSGYAPEVGEELGDPLYLNPNGCNRQFILLSVEQKRAPLLAMTFSVARPILRDWIEANEAALFALTARDAVAGELGNSVFALARPSDLLSIRRIRVEADTTGGHVAHARDLADLVARFRTEPDAWWDDVLIARMIELARQTGDTRRTPIALPPLDVTVRDFWTSHFGGTWLFASVPQPFAVTGDPFAFAADPGVRMPAHGLDQANAIARALDANGLVEPIVKARGVDAAAILRQKMTFLLIEAADARGADLQNLDLHRFARDLGADLPAAYRALAELLGWVEGGGAWPRIASDHPAYFHTLRGVAGPDRDLTDMLLAALAPQDIRQLFISHKDAFYAAYAGWSDTRRRWSVDFLVRDYMVDKPGRRAALYGARHAMPPPLPSDAAAARVGPWGAVQRDTS